MRAQGEARVSQEAQKPRGGQEAQGALKGRAAQGPRGGPRKPSLVFWEALVRRYRFPQSD